MKTGMINHMFPCPPWTKSKGNVLECPTPMDYTVPKTSPSPLPLSLSLQTNVNHGGRDKVLWVNHAFLFPPTLATCRDTTELGSDKQRFKISGRTLDLIILFLLYHVQLTDSSVWQSLLPVRKKNLVAGWLEHRAFSVTTNYFPFVADAHSICFLCEASLLGEYSMPLSLFPTLLCHPSSGWKKTKAAAMYMIRYNGP